MLGALELKDEKNSDTISVYSIITAIVGCIILILFPIFGHIPGLIIGALLFLIFGPVMRVQGVLEEGGDDYLGTLGMVVFLAEGLVLLLNDLF